MTNITIRPPNIKLVQALKLAGAYETGGECSEAVKTGRVQVNGEPCTMRGKKLTDGDTVSADGTQFKITTQGEKT
ncbi:hypothetical protein FACS1894120_6120 [Clostridia bacterium]|nr:hypothetical protein FACS1894120_6120 [Clostridia bacterium]